MENHSIKNGLIYGLASVIYSLVVYLVAPDLLFSMGISMVVGLALVIFFMVRAANAEKEDNEGFLSYGEALRTTFVVFAVGALISTLFTYVLYNFIDSSLLEVMQEQAVETAVSMAERFGAEGEQLEEIREKAMEQDMSFGIGKVALNYIFACIFGLIISLIVSAFVKKNSPGV